jgi:hypothetical protein
VFDIIAPVDAPQIATLKPTAPPAPRPLRRLDEQLLNHLHDVGSCHVWSLLNLVADAEMPRDRTHARVLRLELLGRLRHLRKAGLAFSVGRNKISAAKPELTKRRPTVRRRRPTVAKSPSFNPVSAVTNSAEQEARRQGNQVQFQLDVASPSPSSLAGEATKTESGAGAERISEAARRLAALPRRPSRRWSGWLNDSVRSYRNMRVEFSGDQRAFVFGVLRGRLVYTVEPDGPAGDPFSAGVEWGVLPASAVRILKNEHAVVLGRCKAGVTEVFSLRKQEAARRNSRQPPGANSRPRGRPPRQPGFTPPAVA